ncbi:MAG TPA: hypothetical protein DGO89_16115 [Microcoleaceae bacterium UBA9251]|jgi:hypothetical protein|nr:hypothetical protein [Microcoleaceae cyanobacterium UBA9251]
MNADGISSVFIYIPGRSPPPSPLNLRSPPNLRIAPNPALTAPQASETLPVAQIQPAPASSIAIVPAPASAIVPAPAVSPNPQQDLSFLIGDLLGAKTSISPTATTGDTQLNWLRNNETIISLEVPYSLSVNTLAGAEADHLISRHPSADNLTVL